MSHNVTVSTLKIPSISVIERAVAELQAEGSKITTNKSGVFSSYRGIKHPCQMTIHVEGENVYEIGVVPNPNRKDGGFVLSYDESMCYDNPAFAAAIGTVPGARPVGELDPRRPQSNAVGRLLQRCNVIAAEDAANKEGREFTRTTDPKTKQIVLEVAA